MPYSDVVLADSPSYYYRLGETSGTSIADSSGNSHTLTASATVVPVAGALPFDSNGALNFASSFKITNPNFAPSSGTPITAEVWIKPTGSMANTGIFGAGGSQVIGCASDGLYGRLNGTSSSYVKAPSAFPTGVWTHAVLTFNGTTIVLYVNGVQVATTGSGPGGMAMGWTAIGASPGNSWTGGNFYLDEMAVYQSVLSAARIATHYAEGVGAFRSGFF